MYIDIESFRTCKTCQTLIKHVKTILRKKIVDLQHRFGFPPRCFALDDHHDLFDCDEGVKNADLANVQTSLERPWVIQRENFNHEVADSVLFLIWTRAKSMRQDTGWSQDKRSWWAWEFDRIWQIVRGFFSCNLHTFFGCSLLLQTRIMLLLLAQRDAIWVLGLTELAMKVLSQQEERMWALLRLRPRFGHLGAALGNVGWDTWCSATSYHGPFWNAEKERPSSNEMSWNSYNQQCDNNTLWSKESSWDLEKKKWSAPQRLEMSSQYGLGKTWHFLCMDLFWRLVTSLKLTCLRCWDKQHKGFYHPFRCEAQTCTRLSLLLSSPALFRAPSLSRKSGPQTNRTKMLWEGSGHKGRAKRLHSNDFEKNIKLHNFGQDWCCKSQHKGCVQQDFDCQAGSESPLFLLPENKKNLKICSNIFCRYWKNISWDKLILLVCAC